MADATFDYVNLIITLPAGQTEVDVQRDLYSAWKRSQITNDDPETGAYPAFRTIGGDPLTDTLAAGAYFFIRNDLGWRIRPPEEDITILFTGNLAPEDSAIEVLTPTVGDFSVLILGLQPITQNTEQLLAIAEGGNFGGKVVIDTTSGNTGTEYPTGTPGVPVDNLTDALAIASTYGLWTIEVHGSLTLDQTVPTDFTIRGQTGEIADSVALNGQTVDKVTFENLVVSGTGVGTVDMRQCALSSISGLRGVFSRCGFRAGTFTFGGGASVFSYCFSEVPGTSKPIFDANSLAVSVSFRAYSGGFDLRNFANVSAAMTIDAISASVLIDSSCTAGDLVVRGVGDLTNNGTATVTDNGWMEGGQLFTDVLDEPNGIEVGLTMREAMRLILASAAGKLSGAETTSVTIRNALADSKNRISATVDANGNRTAVTYDVSD